MKKPKMVIHESEGKVEPDICGTVIEMINPASSASTKLSFAKLIISPMEKSQKHYHLKTEEVYFILSGSGEMIIGDEAFSIREGHAIFIPIGAPHQIINKTHQNLIFVCADSPVFEADDVFEVNE